MVQRFSVSLLGLTWVSCFIGLPNANAVSNSKLTVNIRGLKQNQGQVCLSLFASAQGFPNSASRALQAKCVNASQDLVAMTFQNLSAGSYAVAVFHDANGDGALNRNQLGIPREGFGFSRNPTIMTGPPPFGDSAVIVAGPRNDIEIRLLYL